MCYDESAQNGFTLLEVLISLTIVALSVTVYLQLMSAGMKLEYQSGETIALAVQAEQCFEQLQRRDVREDDFQWQGEDDDCTWQLTIEPTDIQVQKWEEDQITLTKNTELYTYILTYACPNEQPMVFRRVVVVDPNFFSDQFKNEHFE